jgi:SnoaL-like domain
VNLTKRDVLDVVEIYIQAWVTQDPDLIVTIFTDEATYHERVLGEPIRTNAGIRNYWTEKVVQSQGNITCKLLSLYLDENTAIVEWEAEFDDRPKATRKRMREIAVLEFAESKKIASLREYWASQEISPLPPN